MFITRGIGIDLWLWLRSSGKWIVVDLLWDFLTACWRVLGLHESPKYLNFDCLMAIPPVLVKVKCSLPKRLAVFVTILKSVNTRFNRVLYGIKRLPLFSQTNNSTTILYVINSQIKINYLIKNNIFLRILWVIELCNDRMCLWSANIVTL